MSDENTKQVLENYSYIHQCEQLRRYRANGDHYRTFYFLH